MKLMEKENHLRRQIPETNKQTYLYEGCTKLSFDGKFELLSMKVYEFMMWRDAGKPYYGGNPRFCGWALVVGYGIVGC